MAMRWLHAAVCTVAVLTLAWAAVGQWIIWVPFLSDERLSLRGQLAEGVGTSAALIKRMGLYQRWSFEDGRGGTGDEHAALEASPMRAPGHVLVVFVVYYLPLFILGLTGWLIRHWPVTNTGLWRCGERLRELLHQRLPRLPRQAPSGALTRADGLVLLAIFAPKVLYLWWFVLECMHEQARAADAVAQGMRMGGGDTHSGARFWVEMVGLWTGTDFLITAPVLFAFVARGSLVNSFLGLSYGVSIKWHKWVGTGAILDVLVHGLAYQSVWISDSFYGWVERQFRFQHVGRVSSLSAIISWSACIALCLTLVPAMRRRAYWVFYWSHIIASAVFVVFGIVHTQKVWKYFAPGLVLYGIDVAYRWLQASHDVTVYITPGTSICSIVIPLAEGVEYGDGGHVWICIPQLGGKLGRQYHPFCVASTPADPAWRSCMLLHCKSYGRWTKKLLKDAKSGELPRCVQARIQGPFESAVRPDVELRSLQHLLVVGGGVGVATVVPALKRIALMRERQEGDGPKIAVYHTARTLDELVVIAPLLPHTGLFDFHLHLTQDVPTAISNAEESPGCLTDNKFDVSCEGGGFQDSSDVLKTIRMSLPLPDFASQENLKPLGISVALNTLVEGPEAWGESGGIPVQEGTLDTVPEGSDMSIRAIVQKHAAGAVAEGSEDVEAARRTYTPSYRPSYLEIHPAATPADRLPKGPARRSPAPQDPPRGSYREAHPVEMSADRLLKGSKKHSLDMLLGPQPRLPEHTSHTPAAWGNNPAFVSDSLQDIYLEIPGHTSPKSHLSEPTSQQTYLNPLSDLHDVLPDDSVSLWQDPQQQGHQQNSDHNSTVAYLARRVEQLQWELDTMQQNWRRVMSESGGLSQDAWADIAPSSTRKFLNTNSSARRVGGMGGEDPGGGVLWSGVQRARQALLPGIKGSAGACKRLKGHTHKWESLVVWVGAWGGSLWLLALGDLYMAAQDPASEEEYNRLVQHRAGFHILACMLTVLLFPLLLIYAYRSVRSMVRGRTDTPSGDPQGPCRHPAEYLPPSNSNSSLIKKNLLSGSDYSAATSASVHLNDDVEAAGKTWGRNHNTAQVMREVVFDVVEGDTLRMRAPGAEAVVVRAGRPGLPRAVKSAYTQYILRTYQGLELLGATTGTENPKIVPSGGPSDAGEGDDGVKLQLNVWAAGPGRMNQAVYAAAEELPPCAKVRVQPMAYEL